MITVRTFWEVFKIDGTFEMQRPKIIDLTISEGTIRFILENGTLLTSSQYMSECKSRVGFVGFSMVFILDNEDLFAELKVSEFQLKYRTGLLKAKSETEFLLSGLIYSLEHLALKNHVLTDIDNYLHTMRPSTPIIRLLVNTCHKLINTSKFLFYDETYLKVPLVVQLYTESKKSNASIICDTLFGKTESTPISTSIAEKVCKDTGNTVLTVLKNSFNNTNMTD